MSERTSEARDKDDNKKRKTYTYKHDQERGDDAEQVGVGEHGAFWYAPARAACVADRVDVI